MAFPQRQRKKNGQSKRKYYERQHSLQKKGSNEETCHFNYPSNSHVKIDESISLDTHSRSNASSGSVGTQLDSNCNYDSIDDSIDCKSLEERLSQLLSVVAAFSVYSDASDDTDYIQDSSNISSIGLNQLAKSLSTIPLCQRLLIDTELAELCEEVYKDTTMSNMLTNPKFKFIDSVPSGQQSFSPLRSDTVGNENAIMLTELLDDTPNLDSSDKHLKKQTFETVTSQLNPHQSNINNNAKAELDSTLDYLLDM